MSFWVDAISDVFLAMEVRGSLRADLYGELHSARLGELGVNWVSASAQDVYRTPRTIARSRENFHYLLGNRDTAWLAEQDGQRLRLLPGDFVLIDSRRPYEFHFPEGASTISLELPLNWVSRWLARPETHIAKRLDARQGWSSVLAGFAMQWRPEMAVAPPLPPALLIDQLGSLLALACGETPIVASTAAVKSLRERVLLQIAERLAEPGLTASDVASSLGVSVRTLHRALMQTNLSFAGSLTEQRMAAAKRMLLTPQFDRLTVGEIGSRVGLLDASQFVRQCKRVLGTTPAALRRRR